jgi:RNA polymerase sigma factor (sigma-70 family)
VYFEALPIDAKLVERLYRRANAARWRVPRERFADALERAAERTRDLDALHLEDLALACACAAGDEEAWDQFVVTYRPILYRSADALDPNGGAREAADAIYGELFGLKEMAGERQSLFHGRSSLATWLRAVVSQRYVDSIRARRRIEPLPDEEGPAPLVAPVSSSQAAVFAPDQSTLVRLVREALARAVANLDSRERLRLACYYAQDLTLAQTGKLLGEHEATCSRQLARTRKALKAGVEQRLRTEGRLDQRTIAEATAAMAEDAGTLDLKRLFRKESPVDRSE